MAMLCLASTRLMNVVGAVPGHLYKSPSLCSPSPGIPLLSSKQASRDPGGLAATMGFHAALSWTEQATLYCLLVGW